MQAEQANIYICAGHVVFFSESVSKQMRDDVLSSGLYLQLAADKKYSRFNALEEWRGVSRELMTLFGWVITQEESVDDASDEVFILDINRVLGKMLGGKVSAPLLARFDTFCHELETADSSRSDMALLLGHALSKKEDFLTGSRSSDAVDTSLSLLISFVSPEGLLVTALVSSTAPVCAGQNILPTHFAFGRVVGHFSLNIMQIEFMEKKYSRARERVIAELAERKSSQIMLYGDGVTE